MERVENKKIQTGFWSRNLKERDYLDDLDADGRKMLK